MGAISNIVIDDAAATPVAHTFKPSLQGLIGRDSVAEFEDREVNDGISVGFYKVHMTMSRPLPQRKSYRVNLKLSTPVLENVTNSTVTGIAPAPTIAYIPLFQLDAVIPERSTLQSRKNIRKMFSELLEEPQVIAALEGLDFPN